MFTWISRFFLPAAAASFLLRFDQRLAAFVAEFERRVEVRFGDLLCRAFIHDDVMRVSHVHQVQIAFKASRYGSGWQSICR